MYLSPMTIDGKPRIVATLTEARADAIKCIKDQNDHLIDIRSTDGNLCGVVMAHDGFSYWIDTTKNTQTPIYDDGTTYPEVEAPLSFQRRYIGIIPSIDYCNDFDDQYEAIRVLIPILKKKKLFFAWVIPNGSVNEHLFITYLHKDLKSDVGMVSDAKALVSDETGAVHGALDDGSIYNLHFEKRGLMTQFNELVQSLYKYARQEAMNRGVCL